MPETQRQVPLPPQPSSREITAAVVVTATGMLLGYRSAGPVGALAFGALALVTGLGAWAVRRRLAADWCDQVQATMDALAEECEEERREVARLRADHSTLEHMHVEAQEEREHAERANQDKTAFLENLSRELRTPLNGILGMGGLLLDTELGEDQRDYARTIQASSEMLLAITDDVLVLTKLDEGCFQLDERDFELAYCVENVVELWDSRASERGISLGCSLDPTIPTWVLGDRSRVRQVLIILLKNAVDRPSTHNVKLDVRRVEESNGGPVVRFSVTHERKKGAAGDCDAEPELGEGESELSLAVGSRLAELMGGTLASEPTPNGATLSFSVRFNPCQREVDVPVENQGMLSTTRLLIIDACEKTRAQVRTLASEWGIEFEAAETASAALKLLKAAAAAGSPFNVALIDSDLPDISGRDLGEVLGEVPEVAGMKCILFKPIGSHDRPTDLARTGFDAWVSKPVAKKRLKTALLHVRTEPVGAANAAPPQRQQEKQLKAHVLVVEDNIVNQKVTSLLLNRIGCSVEVASNGMEAVERVIKASFDLILMDCQMPELDGYEATRAIRQLVDKAKADVPIVAMTAGALESDRETCLAAGMNDHLPKPVRPEELARTVTRWAKDPNGVSQEAETMTNTDEPLLDLEVIASLKELGGEEEPEIFIELIDLFLSDTPERIASLIDALESKSCEDLEAAAHALKGSCGNLGAASLASLFKEIEMCGKDADLESAASLVARSANEFERVEEALRAQIN